MVYSMQLDHLRQLGQQRYAVFEEQDPENGDFDLVIIVAEKRILSHRFIIWSVSNVLQNISIREDETYVLHIQNCSYEDAKEVIKYCYLAECEITPDNFFKLVEMAEMYQINPLREYCDALNFQWKKWLSLTFKLLNLVQNSRMPKLKATVYVSIFSNMDLLAKRTEALPFGIDLAFEILDHIEKAYRGLMPYSSIFQFAFNFSIKKTHDEKKMLVDDSGDFSSIFKKHYRSFWPFISFKRLRRYDTFLYAVSHSNYFSLDRMQQMCEILIPQLKIEVVNSKNQGVFGEIYRDHPVVNLLKNISGRTGRYSKLSKTVVWKVALEIVAVPSVELKELDNWALIYNSDFMVAMIPLKDVSSSVVVLTEMAGAPNFSPDKNCVLKIYEMMYI